MFVRRRDVRVVVVVVAAAVLFAAGVVGDVVVSFALLPSLVPVTTVTGGRVVGDGAGAVSPVAISISVDRSLCC